MTDANPSPEDHQRPTLPARIQRWVLGSKLSWHFTIPSLVVILFVVVVGAVFTTRYVGESLEDDALDDAVRDTEWHSVVVTNLLSNEQLTTPTTGAQYTALDAEVQRHLKRPGVERIKIWSTSGQILYADEPSLVGQTFPIGEMLSRALDGESTAKTSDLDE